MYLARTFGFATLYLLATCAGRLTIMDGTNLSLVWPAAGVAAVWFAVQFGERRIAIDAAAMAVITIAVNVATGAPPALAAGFAVANLVQAGVFAYLFRRWLPGLWGAGGDAQIARPQQLWRLLGIVALATVAGVLIGPTVMGLQTGHYSPGAAGVWIARNAAGMLLISVAGLRLGALRRGEKEGTTRGAVTEGTALIVVSAAAYIGVFALGHGLPLAFVLIVLTVWAGSRMNTTFVILHDLAFGVVTVMFTLAGDGPFAVIESHPLRALVSQLFVAVIAVTGLAVALGRDERVALQHQAAEQARIFASVIDAMGEGLTVIDADGRMLLRNPASETLLAGSVSHIDGKPVQPGDLPYARALATGEQHSMDLLVRDDALPAGRILNFRATPLPGTIAGRSYAVSTFSDVTADRRHRDELAAFAGVVAHDLSNPLTTVEGWSAEVAEELGADSGLAGDGIRRIQRAAVRMRDLINDLLAYATARDKALTPATVDLAVLTTEIAVGQRDHAESTGTAPPQVRIGALPPVHADPAQVRQLLENLIGNAIKYTAQGVVPRVTVTAAEEADDVRVTVVDNGIGIPSGQHRAVFDNFYRAHREAGYAGTGLGLAICKRIVERHGGTITARDNPAGTGTAFTFTLPAADIPVAAPAVPVTT